MSIYQVFTQSPMAHYCNKQTDDLDGAALIQANLPPSPQLVQMSIRQMGTL